MTENESLVINPKDFGLEPDKAKEVEEVFLPVIAERDNLVESYKTIIAKEITPQTVSEAYQLRLKLVKVRTNTKRVHESAKAFYLAGGRFVDAWKNKNVTVVEQMEEKLSEIENHFINIEKAKLAKLKEERLKQLSEVCENPSLYQVESMSEDAFNQLYEGQKLVKQARIEAELKAGQDRHAKIKADEEAREAQRIENEKLKAENEAKEKLLAEERKKADDARKLAEAKAKKEREESEAKLKAEREAKEKLEEQLRQEAQKKQAEEKAKQIAEKKAKSAPDKQKLLDLANKIEALELLDLKSDEAVKILDDVQILIRKLTTFIREKSNQL